MRILIIEDEEPASSRLKKLILEAEPTAQILDVIVSIKSTIEWFRTHESPELIFMDINLSDGNSFEIFEKIDIEIPIIFTTAYDQYSIKAFEVNSVEYLLKPINKEQLKNAIIKFKKFHTKQVLPDLNKLLESFKDTNSNYKKRFLIKYGEHIKAVDSEQIAYFFTEDKINFLRTMDNHTYHLDYNLDRLENMLDPIKFFRINRQFIISIDSIDQMFSYSKSRVKINLKPISTLETIVSTERSPLFKEWLGGKE